LAVILVTASFGGPGGGALHAQQRFDADVRVKLLQLSKPLAAGKGKIAGSVVTERPLLAHNGHSQTCASWKSPSIE
jgi:hypothetical protein